MSLKSYVKEGRLPSSPPSRLVPARTCTRAPAFQDVTVVPPGPKWLRIQQSTLELILLGLHHLRMLAIRGEVLGGNLEEGLVLEARPDDAILVRFQFHEPFRKSAGGRGSARPHQRWQQRHTRPRATRAAARATASPASVAPNGLPAVSPRSDKVRKSWTAACAPPKSRTKCPGRKKRRR